MFLFLNVRAFVHRIMSGGKLSQLQDQDAWQHCLLSATWLLMTYLSNSTKYVYSPLLRHFQPFFGDCECCIRFATTFQ